MRRYRTNSRSNKNEQGIVIVLVAVVMLFVVGAMAALSIDAVTLYTARSEAQLAADAGALAGARVLANSGMTSASTTAVGLNAQPLATAVALQVAASNPVGGRTLTPAGACTAVGEICVTINPGALNFLSNPQITVRVQRADLPTFFARIWGRATITVGASATAEAYNPSNVGSTAGTSRLPVAPTCVKPWLLPNISPAAGGQIFNPVTGAIVDGTLLGWVTPAGFGSTRLRTDCTTTCTAGTGPTVWRYYPGTTDPAGDFPAPAASSVVCPGCTGLSDYQLSIAGCVQKPISCNSTVNIDQTSDGARDTETRQAADGLAHSTVANGGDSVDTSAATPPGGTAPFQFLAGTENPIVLSGTLAADTNIMVSDSLVTVPVINVDGSTTLPLAGFPSVQIIGFVQLFLNPSGAPAPASGRIHTQVINLVGCGIGIAPTPTILGNGASPVAVRLISPGP